MNKKSIYLDYAANTPVDKEVLEVFNDNTLKYFANPNSTHPLGIEANKKIQETTENIMQMLQKETNLDKDTEIIYMDSLLPDIQPYYTKVHVKNFKNSEEVEKIIQDLM